MQSIKNSGAPSWEQEVTFTLEQPPNDENQLHFEVISTPWDNGGRCVSLPFKRTEIVESLGYVNINVGNVVNKRRINKTCYREKKKIFLDVELQWRTSD